MDNTVLLSRWKEFSDYINELQYEACFVHRLLCFVISMQDNGKYLMKLNTEKEPP